MFELTISKQQILPALLMVAGAVDKKQSLPILSNILLQLSAHQFSLTATDLEIQITAVVPCSSNMTGAVTVPAKKIIDIFRSLDEEATPTLSFSGSNLTIKTEHSQFKLTTLAAVDYPITEDEISEVEFSLQASALMRLLQATAFAMAQQDVRVYLNGLFLEIDTKSITAVTADGHRMAVCRQMDEAFHQHHRLLIPKRACKKCCVCWLPLRMSLW